MVRQEDIEYMRRAMELAERGVGFTNPNPMVGAVIVKGGKVIGEGWHERCGEWHAERNAFKNCKVSAEGATMYVTLEPCCHYGKTPPCTEAIIEHGIARVVIGMEDPNPLVAGKGIAFLREAGIEVVCGIEEEALREQNRVFLKYISTRLPWVALKAAMTLDGKIATRTGDSKWITGAEARAYVHELRHRFMAILVGIGTAVADDPLLNCRIEGRGVRQPIRVVVDSNARLSLESQLVQTAEEYRTIVAYTRFAPEERVKALREAGVEMLLCEEKEGLVDSQAPNKVVGEWLEKQEYDYVKPEYVYGNSRIDFYMEKGAKKYLMEVKGCTLEIDGAGYFPDAPTERGTKHLRELIKAVSEGYNCYIAFVIPMEGVKMVYPNAAMDKEFAEAFYEAQAAGVKVLNLACRVEKDELEVL